MMEEQAEGGCGISEWLLSPCHGAVPNPGSSMAARVPGWVESHIRTQINSLLWHYYWVEPCFSAAHKDPVFDFWTQKHLEFMWLCNE